MCFTRQSPSPRLVQAELGLGPLPRSKEPVCGEQPPDGQRIEEEDLLEVLPHLPAHLNGEFAAAPPGTWADRGERTPPVAQVALAADLADPRHVAHPSDLSLNGDGAGGKGEASRGRTLCRSSHVRVHTSCRAFPM